ncbi:MAG: hypothetical protein IPI03_00855 [Rubrivivax sp.]|nr:hypothetical protein [Rubrivivax sp.]MBK8526178.1 hypothetical protein [Rubrivivax sp.]
MSPRGWRRLVTALLAVLLAAAAWWGWQAWLARQDRVVQAFIAGHWAQPLAPQGKAPANWSALEASLEPQSCGQCHAQQFADWSTSLHSRAVGPGLRWQLRTFEPAQANQCLNCHAPLAEQKALTALEHGWPNAPAASAPAFVGAQLHRQGLVCAACHVRAHQRFGPPGVVAPSASQPHGGYVAAAGFSDSRFCSSCHQFPPDGRRVNGKLVEDTYEEWRVSPYAKEGRSCQSCHMPGRRHLWRGVHDASMVDAALGRELRVQRLDATRIRVSAVMRNRGAGHRLPTYLVPKIRVELHLYGERPADHLRLGHHVIGRTVDVALERELADTRLAPGEQQAISFETAVPAGAWRVVLRTVVAPAEHYERMFAEMDRRHPEFDVTTRNLLHEARSAAEAARFTLPDLTLAVPAAAGAQASAQASAPASAVAN